MKLRAIAIVLLFVSSMVGAARDDSSYGVMVWDGECISAVFKTKTTRLEAPMKDGSPDKSKMKLIDVGVTLDPACGHIEVRKK